MPVFLNNFVSPKMAVIFEFFAKIAKHKNAYISKTVLDRAILANFLNHRVSLQSSHANFQKKFVSPKIAAILNFAKIVKHRNTYILKTVLDRADYADFGCPNSIRLEAEHFLYTSALTFISFSGCFVFAVQKQYLFFFVSDPLVVSPTRSGDTIDSSSLSSAPIVSC